MNELDKNQQVADSICRDFEWEGRKFQRGEWVSLLDGEIVAAATDLDQALHALRKIDSDPRRGMLVEVHKPIVDVIRFRPIRKSFGKNMDGQKYSTRLFNSICRHILPS